MRQAVHTDCLKRDCLYMYTDHVSPIEYVERESAQDREENEHRLCGPRENASDSVDRERERQSHVRGHSLYRDRDCNRNRSRENDSDIDRDLGSNRDGNQDGLWCQQDARDEIKYRKRKQSSEDRRRSPGRADDSRRPRDTQAN
jgi:hypothetical protein